MAHYTASDNETLKMCNAWNMEHNVQSFNINIDIAMGNANYKLNSVIRWFLFIFGVDWMNDLFRFQTRNTCHIYIYISIKHQMSIIITTILHDSRCRNSRTSHPIHCNSNDLFIFIPIRDPSLWIRKHYERWERK